MWKFLVLSLIPLVTPECSIKTESGEDIPWDSYDHVLGSFEKTVVAGTPLAGIVVDSVRLISVRDGKCGPDKTLNITQFNETYIAIVAKDFSQWDTSPASDGCDFSLYLDATLCPEGTNRDLNFRYNVRDVNLVPPKLNSDSYSIKIPFPIAPGVSLTSATNLIITSNDQDFSTKNVTYTIEEGSDDFDFQMLTFSGRNFPVSLQTKRLVNLQKPVVLTLTVTDDGTNPAPLSSSAKITIEPDLENSIPPKPEFSQTLYKGELKLADIEVGDSIPLDISLAEGLDDLTLAIEPADLFTATLTGTSVSLTLSKDLGVDGEQYVDAVLTATVKTGAREANTSAVIVIELVEESDNSTSSSSTTTTSTTTTTEQTLQPDPVECPSDTDSGLVAATVIFVITTVILAGVVGYGYYKYVHKRPAFVPTSEAFQSPTRANNPGVSHVETESEGGKLGVTKPSRKRSMTFTEDDEASRANRENKSDVETGL